MLPKNPDLSKSILGKYQFRVTEPFGKAGRDCSVIIGDKEVKLTLGRDPLEPNQGIEVDNFELPDIAFKNFKEAFMEEGLEATLTEKDKDKPLSLQLNTILEGNLIRVNFDHWLECSI